MSIKSLLLQGRVKDFRAQRSVIAQRERTRGWLIIGCTLTLLIMTAGGWISIHSPADWHWYIDAYTGEQGQGADGTGDSLPAGDAAGKGRSARDFGRQPWQWIDWITASLLGVLIYILAEAAHWHGKEDSAFIAYTPWYISTAVKAPIIAFAILLFLTNVSVDVSGLSVNFAELGPAVLLAIAFVLGFYGRVAREQLNQVVKMLFGKAYSAAEEEFTIEPATARVVLGQSVQFSTHPFSQVTWLASAGQIADGLYTAPAESEAIKHGQIVQITAVPKDPNVPPAVASAQLVRFEIAGSTRVAYGAIAGFRVLPRHDVIWSVSPAINGASIDSEGAYRAPTREEAKSAGLAEVTISATGTGDEPAVATLNVELCEEY